MRTPVALPTLAERCSAMQMLRFIKSLSFPDWLLRKAPQSRGESESPPDGPEEDLAGHASQTDLDARIDKLVSSRDLKPPE
jgi:hypothetical protein